ncbi:class IV adenylate cyclase [Candidatus Peregrinibacteria bacterium]|nr:class IV adenylate cyclase [Candidatus Peregrinibacteria bacterium]
MRIEVEMKAWLKTEEEIETAREYLKKHGKFLKKSVKDDIYFAKPNAETFDFRIREVDGKYFVTEKKRKLVGKMEQNEELEFEVSDKEAFIALTKNLGYVVFLRKTKKSEVYELEDRITAEITTVGAANLQPLGTFLEIEKLCEREEESGKARKEIQKIFQELDLEKNIETRQYAVMLKP